MWFVNKRYVNDDSFERKSKVENPFVATTADKLILSDKDPNFRVLNLTVNPFKDANTPYFHKSLGGYHGAKLGRYQELIEHQLYPEISKMSQVFSGSVNPQIVDETLAGLSILNMLNTKYLIINPQSRPILNKYALGNAWFVKDYKLVDDANAEITTLSDFNPSEMAIVDVRFEDQLQGFIPGEDSTAIISFIEYKPNYLNYNTSSQVDQLAVFSEIYYKSGWNAYVDGKLTPHFRTDYVLRAMVIPAGKHVVEFKFEPQIFNRGEVISWASSLLLILLGIGVIVAEIIRAIKNRS